MCSNEGEKECEDDDDAFADILSENARGKKIGDCLTIK